MKISGFSLAAVMALLQASASTAGPLLRASSSPLSTTSPSGRSLEFNSDRLGELDTSNIVCGVAPSAPDAPRGNTVIEFYYKIESTGPLVTKFPSDLTKIEEKLFYTISAGILWCYQINDSAVDVGNRLLSEVHSHPQCTFFFTCNTSIDGINLSFWKGIFASVFFISCFETIHIHF